MEISNYRKSCCEVVREALPKKTFEGRDGYGLYNRIWRGTVK